MPLMDGFQLAQNLVRRDLNARICFMTQEKLIWMQQEKNICLRVKARFIKKPITAEELLWGVGEVRVNKPAKKTKALIELEIDRYIP